MTAAALIVAAGRGARAARDGLAPKQYAPLAGRPVLAHAIAAFEACPGISSITVVIHPDDRDLYAASAPKSASKLKPPVPGGATRQDSVRLGLASLEREAPRHVLIHDAARPFVAPETIARVLAALETHEGALAAEPLADTLKRDRGDGTVSETVPRAGLWKAQTPQGFRYAPILAAHGRAAAQGRTDFTDDAAIAEWAGIAVTLVESPSRNFKLTTQEDLIMAEQLLRPEAPLWEPRTGTGFDVHAFCEGDHVWLGGVRIPHDRGLLGHSDADAPLHALTDALLGAIGDGDIGQHFPPSDPAWKGARSRVFVEDAAARIAKRGGRITNVDVTILCEAPRIGPHRDAIRNAIAGMLGIELTRVAVKATTTEQLGFTGRKEGIAALASATVLLPA
ncbi:bifunctional 2-C-methyl-D-erythritol 4-phosphate cytidylyltransferase/2-C-methyl-D-erythritol 2,4-cyclodiphosphate synthase [Hyphomicrobium sp. DMF-1]|uniref:bifunctional 2-C-methyl-D-erythritol 4-phosphate cytidylyltransferase/2-C-methyl-D-erythritol 2,4-cyclodiphosphate synthase n=1 Tax=Hyphomicrobium sp. DMF-1 TaxID=3019544 RepID=UPI0022EBB59B|nr:bifunctional 2-C-methyl-D-erythritol 4-phosphate cytidylyltransferase/2-C-methyl-D-erythritol 2,4-cyclodiphosphate synthase [Hyphomicrobium sp. DMF-1]WBT36397.1 bifunctional 2-C-methyl-D-erythritol 4-phosphate cytidylyltransferase/2-C-methyl-D-erythritol 2,4-cyclodiphosphate synthase [Hyphomicrobium sp. DMF-1]